MKIEDLLETLNSGELINGKSLAALRPYSEEARKITMKINSEFMTNNQITSELEILFSQKLEEFCLFPPFTTDFGKNTKIGRNVFINSGSRFQDQGGITIGNDVLIGHNAVIATLNHDQNPEKRGDLWPSPVIIEDKVRLGSNVTILPGVTVGYGAIIATGSVVTKDVEANTVVGGVPAKKIKDVD